MRRSRLNNAIRSRRLTLETLERREVPAYYLVLGAGDASGLVSAGGTGSATHPFEFFSLRSALEQTDATKHTADIIRFDSSLANDTIVLSPDNPPLQFAAGAKTTIQGTNLNITIDGGGVDRDQRVFDVSAGASAEIDDVTIQNGFDGQPPAGGDDGGDIARAILSTDGGGGVRNSGVLSMTGVTVRNNSSFNNLAGGGGIFNNLGAKLNLTDCLVDSNSANTGTAAANQVPGGGIENRGTAAITACTISENLATSLGGGIDNSGTLTIKNSTISGNQCDNPVVDYGDGGAGGGIANTGKLMMTNTTIAQNIAGFSGGGLDNSGLGGANMLNCTITENLADTGGGIHMAILSAGKTFKMRNTIVSGNGNSDEAPDDINTNAGPTLARDDSITISAAYCLIGTFSGVTIDGNGNQLNVNDPMLGGLQDNGGPTRTEAPLPGSPALDMGDPNRSGLPSTDQRGKGFVRVSNGRVDIGAVEVQVEGSSGNSEGGSSGPSGDRRYH
jgi:hypothetical protein